MTNPADQYETAEARISKRPFICTIILSIALTYFLMLTLLSLSGLIFYDNIIDAIRVYIKAGDPSPKHFLVFVMAASVLFLSASAGIVMFFLKRKTGFYLFVSAALLIFLLDLVFLQFDWLRYLFHTGLIFILGIAHFSRRCYWYNNM